MHDKTEKLDDLLNILGDIYQNRLPFNRVLGLRIIELKPELVTVDFNMTGSLVGNYIQESLHGGVISSVLDVVGGLTATTGMIQKKIDRPQEEIRQNISRVGTIDLRIDYLRPGRGKTFTASASIMRIGNKVAVTRMELHNDHQRLIAVGTGTYLIA
jgi:uncharacterized protein (TIGR00369 family)